MLSMTLQEWEEILKQWGEPKFRAKQIFDWLHKKQITEIDEMTNISKGLREKLKQNGKIACVKQVKKLVSQIDGTTKYLFEVENGLIIERPLVFPHR